MNVKITRKQAQDIIDCYLYNDFSTKTVASKYGVSPSNVTCIVNGKSWPDLKRPSDLAEILMRKGCYSKVARQNLLDLSAYQRELIFGSLLGDGTLTNISDNANSAFKKLQKHEEHVSWLAKELSPYSREKIYEGKRVTMPVRQVGKVVNVASDSSARYYVMRTIAHPVFTSMRRIWYNEDGLKVVPRNLTLTPLILAIWYVDDGSTYYKGRTCDLSTHCFTMADVEFLRDVLQKDLDLCGRINKHYGKPRIVFCGDNYDKLLDVVTPFVIWNCFSHKILHRKRSRLHKGR